MVLRVSYYISRSIAEFSINVLKIKKKFFSKIFKVLEIAFHRFA